VFIALFILPVQIAQVLIVKVASPLASIATFGGRHALGFFILGFLFFTHQTNVVHVKIAIPVLVKAG
jgi:hypothetical protein